VLRASRQRDVGVTQGVGRALEVLVSFLSSMSTFVGACRWSPSVGVLRGLEGHDHVSRSSSSWMIR